ncbi:kinase-like domain-containing protein [Rhizophagus irregularis DAOM 181602=DAOM 197198]|nr:kinase-like domain-containing protein [Rhizophagus irregularis DAOM 181602=DAOM 197198]
MRLKNIQNMNACICLHKQESIDSLINEAKKYPTKYETFQALYGISQNPDTGDYILVQNNSIIMADHIIALKCYNSVDFLINKAEKYLTKTNMLNMFNRGICVRLKNI